MPDSSPFAKILVGTDFSEPSAQAARAAAILSARSSGALALAHSYEPPLFTNEALAISVEDAARQRLQEEAGNLRQAGSTVEEHFSTGPAQQTLCAVARQINAGTIVLASHKKRGVAERWFVDGIIERISQTAASPTLVVRDVRPFEQWAQEARPLKILVATDLSSGSDAPLQWVKALAALGPAEITAAYVNWIPEEAVRLGFRERGSFFDASPEMQALLRRDLREKVKRVFGETPVQVLAEPRWGRADAPLIELASAAGADLLVVGTHQRRGWSSWLEASVSRGALNHAPMNVAIVPLREQPSAEAALPVYDRVLAPTDFSAPANRAIAHAYALAAPGGKVGLAYVTGGSFDLSDGEARQRLQELIPAQATERGVQTEIIIVENRITAEGINQAAARFGADAVVMGSHGKTGLLPNVLGSVAQGVLAESSVPVLIVRHKA